MTAKPSTRLDWVTSNDVTKITEPSSGKKALGWISAEKPAFQFFNWGWNIIDQWLKYFEAITDILVGQYDIVVGAASYCTHATLAAAVADAAQGAQKRVLLCDDASIASTIHLTKANWIITAKPGVTYTKNAVATGISCEASGIEIRGLRMVSWSTGGDKAITGTSAWTYGRILFCNFLNCDTEIDDTSAPAGKKPVLLGNISE